jgi:hypothetical protein
LVIFHRKNNDCNTLFIHIMLRNFIIVSWLLTLIFGVNTIQAQEYYWLQNRYPLGLVPSRYAGAERPLGVLNTLPYPVSATTRTNNALLRSITPVQGAYINAATSGTVVSVQLAPRTQYKRVLAVFVADAQARSVELVGGDSLRLRATLPKILHQTGFRNTLSVPATVVLERERDTVIAQSPVWLTDSTYSPEDVLEAQWRILRTFPADSSYEQAPIAFAPEGGDASTEIAIYNGSPTFGFHYTSDTLSLRVEAVTIGGVPVQSFEIKNRTTIYATVGTVRFGEVVVHLRCRENRAPLPMVVRLPARDSLPERDTTLLLPNKREYILPLTSRRAFGYTGGFAAPTVTDFSPKSGNSGTTVTVYGTNFSTTNTNSVWVGGIMAGNVEVISSTELRATIGYTTGSVAAAPVDTTSDGYLRLPSFWGDIERRVRLQSNGAPLSHSRYPGAHMIIPPHANGPVRVIANNSVQPLNEANFFNSSVYTYQVQVSPAAVGDFRYVAPSLTIATLSAQTGSEGSELVIQGGEASDYRAVRQVYVCGVPVAAFTLAGRNTLTARLGTSRLVLPNAQAKGRVQLVATARYLPHVDSLLRVHGRATDRDSLVGESEQEFTFIQRRPPSTVTSLSATYGEAGTELSIRGTALDSVKEVWLGEPIRGIRVAALVVDSASHIRVVMGAPNAAQMLHQQMVNTEQELTLVFENGGVRTQLVTQQRFMLLQPPSISAIAPASAGMDSTIHLTGTYFSAVWAASIGDVPAAVTVHSPTSMSLTVPELYYEADALGVVRVDTVKVATYGGEAARGGFRFIPAPVITDYSPASATAGTLVLITGANFSTLHGGGITHVRFGTATTAVVAMRSATEALVRVPANASTGDIAVVTHGGTASITDGFRFLQPPRITSFSPARAGADTAVVIRGEHFTNVVEVNFGGVSASWVSVDSLNQITARVPLGATSGTIEVITADGAVQRAGFTYISPPLITACTPLAATIGTVVLLEGDHFANASAVTFGGVAAQSFVVVSPTRLRAVVGAGSVADAVAIVTPGGGASLDGFTVIAPPIVTHFSPNRAGADSSVVIRGQHFENVVEVKFGGVSASAFTVDSSTHITATVPAMAASGAVEVVNSDGAGSRPGFTFIPAPTITRFTPARATAGTVITIEGTEYTDASSVIIGGVAASSFVVVSPTRIRAHVAEQSVSGVITVITPGGAATAEGFTMLLPPRISAFSPDSAEADGEVLITGRNFSTVTSVKIGGTEASAFTVESDEHIRAVVAVGSASGFITVSSPDGVDQKAGFIYRGPFAAPTISNFTPTSATAGTIVTINGTNLHYTTRVRFGGVEAASFVVVSPTRLRAVVATASTSGAVSVITQGGSASRNGFAFIPAPNQPARIMPTISSFSPASAAAGMTVTVRGVGFTGASIVRLGGVDAQSFVVANDSTLTAVVSAVGGATGVVSVVAPGGTATRSGFTFIAPPTITHFSPSSTGVGGTVVIQGAQFSTATSVRFGSGASAVPASSFIVNSDTQITAIVSTGASGSVSVTTLGGTATRAGFMWAVVPTLTSISHTSAAQGMSITLRGAGFTGASAVRFGGVAAQSFVVVNDSTLTAVLGTGASGAVSVTTPGGTASLAGFTVVVPPSGFTAHTPPASATIGTPYTYTFVANGTPAPTYSVASGTLPTGLALHTTTGVLSGTPAVAGTFGPLTVQATNAAGSTTSTGFTIVVAPLVQSPVLSNFSPASASAGTSITLRGTGFTGASAVRFGGVAAQSFVVVNDSTLTAVLGTGASGAVSVTTPGGTASLGGFTVVPPSASVSVPVVQSFTPSLAGQGTSVTVRGRNFTGTTAVQFGGVAAQSLSVANDSTLTAVVGMGASGAVRVTNPAGTGSLAGFVYGTQPPPVAQGFSPTSARADDTLSIVGVHFLSATTVSIGGVAVRFTAVSDTLIRAVMSSSVISGAVRVVTPSGSSQVNGFTFIAAPPAPSITSFTPANAGAGTTVTITGTNFSGASAVRFGAFAAASFVVQSATRITAVVATDGGSGAVSVVSAGGTATRNGFTFIPPAPTITSIAPASARVGDSVVITGTNLGTALSVEFGTGTTFGAASFTVISNSRVVARVPANAVSGSVRVTTLAGQGSYAGFVFLAPPTLSALSPTSGGSGSTITLTGTGFTGATAVTIGGVAASSFTVLNDTQITAVLSSATVSGAVLVTTPNGSASRAGFTFLPAPTLSAFSPSAAALGGTVTITGTGFTGTTAVTFGGTAAQAFTVVSDTRITARVGTGTSGEVRVTTPNGTGARAGFSFAPVPTVSSFTPTSSTGSDTITITGTGFIGVSAVSFGATAAQTFTVVSSTQIRAVVSNRGSSGAVRVTTLGGAASLAGFTFLAPLPVITGFTPSSASVAGTVSISGRNFSGDDYTTLAVSFGGRAAASFIVVNDSTITAQVAGGATGAVSVRTPGGAANRAGFTFIPDPPSITSISPSSAPQGATVTINGLNFLGATAVRFGIAPSAVAAASFTVVNDSTITARVGMGASGGVLVITPSGTANRAGFTFLAAPSISGFAPVSATVSDTVILTGTGFTGASAVRFGSTTAARFTVVSDTEIRAVVASGSTGIVTVVSPNGRAIVRALLSYRHRQVSVILPRPPPQQQ